MSLTFAGSWIDPYTPRYSTPPQLLDEVCAGWQSGVTKRDLRSRTQLPDQRVSNIIAANFQIEWIPESWVQIGWPNYSGNESDYDANFEKMGSRSRQLRDPLMGQLLESCPIASLRCRLCWAQWLSGETGCAHFRKRPRYSLIQCAITGDFGSGYTEPDHIPEDLSVEEVVFFKEKLQRLHFDLSRHQKKVALILKVLDYKGAK